MGKVILLQMWILQVLRRITNHKALSTKVEMASKLVSQDGFCGVALKTVPVVVKASCSPGAYSEPMISPPGRSEGTGDAFAEHALLQA